MVLKRLAILLVLLSSACVTPIQGELGTLNDSFSGLKYSLDDTDILATPKELAEHGGDCADFAYSKALLAREMGYEPKIYIVEMNRLDQELHAITMVETVEGKFWLDWSMTRHPKFTKVIDVYTIEEFKNYFNK